MRLGHCLLTFILVLATAAPAVLPHVTQLAPGVYASGFAAEHGWANCGWVAARDSTLLIDLPKGIGLDESVPQIEKITGKQVRSVLFTDAQNASSAELAWLAHRGVKVIAVSQASLGLEV